MPSISTPDSGRNYAIIAADGDGEGLLDVDPRVILEVFETHGAVLFRGYPLDLQTFNALSARFCSSFAFNESGGRQTITPDGRTQTVNLGQDAFPLHCELSREPWRPDIAWFACVTPPKQGGETLICDGVAVARALSAETRALLERRSLRHKQPATPEDLRRWLGVTDPDEATLGRLTQRTPFAFTLEDGRYYRAFVTPVLQKPMFADEPAFANFLLFARYYLKIRHFPTFEDGTEIPDEICAELKRITDELTVPIEWQTHDLVMLDNTRFMHGRNAIEDPSQRVILTQFGYAAFAPLDEDTLRAQPWRQRSATVRDSSRP